MKVRNSISSTSLASALFFYAFVVPALLHGQTADWVAHHPPLFPTNEWGVISNSCQLGLRLPKLQYEVGEQIVAGVIFRNVGDENLRFASRDQYTDYEVMVKRADGGVVPYTDSWARDKGSHGSAVFRAVTQLLGPHQESLAASGWINITERYRMNQPGPYVVTLTQHVILSEPEPTKRFDLLSNSVTITIVAAKK